MHAFLACGVVPPYAAYQGVGTVRRINEELSKCNSLLIQDCSIIASEQTRQICTITKLVNSVV